MSSIFSEWKKLRAIVLIAVAASSASAAGGFRRLASGNERAYRRPYVNIRRASILLSATNLIEIFARAFAMDARITSVKLNSGEIEGGALSRARGVHNWVVNNSDDAVSKL